MAGNPRKAAMSPYTLAPVTLTGQWKGKQNRGREEEELAEHH